MDIHPENKGKIINYDERTEEYTFLVKKIDNDMSVTQRIYFCPWCGEKLPNSQRDRWFDELEALGVDPLWDPIPLKYQTSEWRKK